MTNDTPAPIGADAALARLVAAVEAETDPDWVCNSYHPSLWPALKAARAALASAAQPAPAHQQALENVALLADILNRRPAMNAGLAEAYAHWTAEVYDLMGAIAAEPAYDAAAPQAAPAAHGDALDAARWRMLPAFFHEYQIDAMKLYRDIDSALAAKEGASHAR